MENPQNANDVSMLSSTKSSQGWPQLFALQQSIVFFRVPGISDAQPGNDGIVNGIVDLTMTDHQFVLGMFMIVFSNGSADPTKSSANSRQPGTQSALNWALRAPNFYH